MDNNFKDEEPITGHLRSLIAPVGVAYVSSFVPRKCGIATFTKYLTDAIDQINPLEPARIIALDNPESSSLTYSSSVKFRINDNSLSDYKKAAKHINRKKVIDVVNIQHEFQLYGPNHGENIVDFLKAIKKPVITTVHNVRTDLGENRKKFLSEIYDNSTYIVVMLDSVKELFAQVTGKDPGKIVAIPHGVLDFQKMDSSKFKKKLRLQDKIVMSSINLLSHWKGIEFAIMAVPEIIEKIPNFIYLVIGETHPVDKLAEGETYREKLENLVTKLGLEKHVRFINRYVSVSEQKEFIGASDFYITPYLAPQQASSGSLAFAIGAGKVCISTPYLFSKDTLKRGKGIIVPFRSAKSISNAVVSVMGNPSKMAWYQNEAYKVGRLMTWVNVGHQYFHLFQEALEKSN